MYILHLALKTGQDRENSRKRLPFVEKIVKIRPVDTEIALLRVNKEEITEGKIYSPVGKFAERANDFNINRKLDNYDKFKSYKNIVKDPPAVAPSIPVAETGRTASGGGSSLATGTESPPIARPWRFSAAVASFVARTKLLNVEPG